MVDFLSMWKGNLMILYNICYYFYIYALVGWIWETCLCSVRERKFINRGFLNGPLCPIYGFGMISLIVFLYPITSRLVDNGLHSFFLLFVGGGILCSVLEYFTSWLLEILFDASWWDYSKEKFNIKGRICLKASLFWGVMSALIIMFIQPIVKGWIDSLPQPQGTYILWLLISITSIDFIVTVAHLISLRTKIQGIRTSIKQLREDVIIPKLYEDVEERLYLFDKRVDEIIYDIQTRIEKFDFKEDIGAKDKISARIEELRSKYKDFKLPNLQERRILKAFPKMKLRDFDEVLKEIKEKAQQFKK